MKAYHINATAKAITAVDYETLADLQRLVGGDIETAHRFTGGDVVFVNDEGLFKYQDFFIINGAHQPFAGNGVLVGRERHNSIRTRDPKISIEGLRELVTFASRFKIQQMIARGEIKDD